MAKSRRKDPSEYLDGKILMDILAHLSKVSYFDLTVHRQEDYSLVEEYFEIETDADPEYLGQFTRIVECTLLLDSTEYQSMVLQLCGSTEIARNTKQYIHMLEMRGTELCLINLYRDIRRQVKKTGKKKVTKPANSSSKSPASTVTPEQVALQIDKDLTRLEKQLRKAVEVEDYHRAAHIQKQIESLKGE